MNLRLFAIATALFCTSFAVAAEEENPYKKAKVGDYASFSMVTKLGEFEGGGTITQTVIAKDDKEVTIKMTGEVNGMEVPAREQKIDLTKPFDPTKAGNLPGGADAKIEKLKDGTEKLKLGGKEYETKWESYKLKTSNMGQEVEINIKIWQAKDLGIPVVKTEMTAEVMGNKMEMKMEMKETGHKELKKE